MSKRSESGNDWVTIASFSWLQQALVLKTLLESEEIEAFIPEGHIGTTPFVSAMQIRLQVRERDEIRARDLIASFEPPSQERCPECDGELIEEAPYTGSNWLRFLAGLFTGVPMRARSKAKVCTKCGKNPG